MLNKQEKEAWSFYSEPEDKNFGGQWLDDQNRYHRDDDLPAHYSDIKLAESYAYNCPVYMFHGKDHRTFGSTYCYNSILKHEEIREYWVWLDKTIEDEEG